MMIGCIMLLSWRVGKDCFVQCESINERCYFTLSNFLLIAMKAVPSVGIPSIRSTVPRVLVADLGNWKYDAKLSTA